MTSISQDDPTSLDEATLVVSLPPTVRDQLCRGAAVVLLESPIFQSALLLRADGRAEPVPSGLFRVRVVTPTAEALSGTLELASKITTFCQFFQESFREKGTRLLSLSGDLDRALGGTCMWFRLLAGPTRRPARRSHRFNVLLDGSVEIEVEGMVDNTYVTEIAVLGSFHVVTAVDWTYLPPANQSRAVLQLTSQGGLLTYVALMQNRSLSRAASLLGEGQIAEARRAVDGIVSQFRGGGRLPPTSSALVGLILLRLRADKDLSAWFESLSLNDRRDPDVLAVAAEWFGLAGYHLAALNQLLQLTVVGYPRLSGCYSLAVARIAAYATTSNTELGDAMFMHGQDSREIEESVPKGISQRSQQLEVWNIEQARSIRSFLSIGDGVVAWSEQLLKIDHTGRIDLQYWGLRTRLRLLLATRFGTGWAAIRWSRTTL